MEDIIMFQKTSKILFTLLLAAFMMLGTLPANAKVSKAEADRLKNELTPAGAERVGNADGTIPAWTGGLKGIPEGITFQSGDTHPNPFADDKVLYTITAQNMDQYADKLSEGLKAQLKRYPDTFKMNVYPTRRSAAAPQKIYDNTYNNALTAELIDDGVNGFKNALGGYPFPIPKRGVEVIYNHLSRWQGYGYVANTTGFMVHGDGSRNSGGSGKYTWWFPYYVADSAEELDRLGNYQTAILIQYNNPARRKGEILLAKDRLDYSDVSRAAWQYLPGQRRIRRSPSVSYDTPNPTFGGWGTYDDSFMFNGQPDRFDWKIIGKKEMYVPYNNYDYSFADFDDLLTPNHENPEFVRWELHRVWEIEATVRPGFRHCYGKRVFWHDEDTWIALLKDNYDTRGNLWRFMYNLNKNRYDIPCVRAISTLNYDLTVATYNIGGLTKGEPPSYEVPDMDPQVFTAKNVRRLGKR